MAYLKILLKFSKPRKITLLPTFITQYQLLILYLFPVPAG